ncbi:MAG TPA: hypothetical protein VIB79_31755 [Candidatus Binatia bacterium]|jgi:hypothetical protein
MKITCEHCEEAIHGSAYRVISHDEDGSILLNMVVCEPCYERAIGLGLRAEEIRPPVRRPRRPMRPADFSLRLAF